jgi:hypothetical protein
MHIGWRTACIVIGVALAALGGYAAYTFGVHLEGGVSYLALAAPVIAVAAALIPPIAEAAWASKQRIKALLWWAVLIPAAACVFFSAAERVHTAKAGATAERAAKRSIVDREKDELASAKAEQVKARDEARKAEARKTCNMACREAKVHREEANSRVMEAESALEKAEKSAVTESSMQAPVWLLPSALDLIAFMAIWTGLTGPKVKPKAVRNRKPRKAKAKRKPKPMRPTDLDHLRLVQ